MKKLLFILTIITMAMSIPGQAQNDPNTRAKITLVENTIYTVPEGKTWTVDANLLDQITFCESENCVEPIHFFKSVTQKVKIKKATIEGYITLPRGMILKTLDQSIQVIEQPDTK